MPRPPRCRRICDAPQVDTFCPNGCENTEPILLTLDEYEVIRLVDLEQQTHEQCAAQMDISRSTVQEIYEGARRKIAACLVHGKPLHITGGNYRICGGQEAAHCGRCCRMQRANTEKTGKNLAALYSYEYIPSLDTQSADILVNVTPIGMKGGKEEFDLAFPENLIQQAQTAFDVVAVPAETPFIQFAQQQGKQTISGAEVIVLQAVEQFELYTGVRPDDQLVAEAAAFARANS